MCGIAGIYHYRDPGKTVDQDLLVRMTRTLRHRGPDDEGFFVRGPVGFGHRRLAIVDLTATGHQPMATADGSCWISYNGEFYNHADFVPGLEARGCSFRGTSDTETLLYLMQHEGPRALARTTGIFGFSFWDSRNEKLVLARDHVGVKQIYFHDDGKRVLFASEIKALFCDPRVPRELDPEAVNEYLHFHTPLFERTFFKGIRQVRPATFITFGRGGRSDETYWHVDSFAPRGGTPEQNADELRDLFAKVVRDQLMSDVPVGSFFSGGIDSSAVAEFASRAGRRPRCFGVHFENQGVIDEGPYQVDAAKALGVDLDLITLDGSTFPEDFHRLMYQQDQPLIGAAIFPMDAVSKLAASRVKVCLGGQAADEVFGGYARYALTRPLRVLLNATSGERSSAPGSAHVGGNLAKQIVGGHTLRRLARAAMSLTSWRERYFANYARVEQSAWSKYFADPRLVSTARARAVFRDTVASGPQGDPATKAMYWDLQTYLPGLFQQDDRMSMAHSLESRVPFADPRVVSFAFRTDFDLKFRSGASKWILRRALADVLPEKVLNRRKAGFDTPAERWMRELHSGFVRETLLSTKASQRGIWETRAIEKLLANPGRPFWFDVVWKILSIEIWARVFLDGDVSARCQTGEAALPAVIAG